MLMNANATSDTRTRADRHMATKHHAVGQDHVVFHGAVVCRVGRHHK